MADNYPVKDGADVTQTFRSTDSAGVQIPHGILTDTSGVEKGTYANPLVTFDTAKSAGNVSIDTLNPGTGWAAFATQAARRLTISNNTGTTIEVRQGGGGVAFPIPTGQMFTFRGISNLTDLSLRRTDTSNTIVTVAGRWEV